MGLEIWTVEEEPGAEELAGAKDVALERKKQFEAVCPQLLQVGEALAVPALKDLIPARPVYATKWGAELDPRAVAAGHRKLQRALEEQKAVILVPHDFPLAGAKHIRSKWLDYWTFSGAEGRSRLVATEVAYGNRDDCIESTPTQKAQRLAVSQQEEGDSRFFEVVAAFARALIDELVILLLLGGPNSSTAQGSLRRSQGFQVMAAHLA